MKLEKIKREKSDKNLKKKLFPYEVTWLAEHEMGDLLNFSQSKIMRKFGKPRKLEQAQAAPLVDYLKIYLVCACTHLHSLTGIFDFSLHLTSGKKQNNPISY